MWLYKEELMRISFLLITPINEFITGLLHRIAKWHSIKSSNSAKEYLGIKSTDISTFLFLLTACEANAEICSIGGPDIP